MKQISSNVLHPFYRRISRFAPDICAVLALGVFALLAVIRYPLVRGEQDIGVYASIADRAMQVMHGTMTGVSSEYPPLATVLFWFAKALLPHADFAVPWLLLMVVSAVCAWVYLRCYSIRDASIFAVILPVSVLLLGHDLIFSRFDFYVSVALLLCWRTHHYGSFAESAGWLCAAILLKLVPVLAVPFFILALPKRAYIASFFGVLFACGAAAVLCYGVLGYDATVANISYMLAYHGHRAVQLETVWSGMSMLVSMLAGRLPHTGFGNMSIVNYDVPLLVGKAAKALILVGTTALVFSARRYRQQQNFGALTLLVLLGALIVSPVLSPQYFVWIIPLLLFYVLEQCAEQRFSFSLFTIAVTTLCISVLTQWIFPSHYQELMSFDWTAIFVLNIRNGLMVFLFLGLAANVGLLRFAPVHTHRVRRNILLRMGIQTCVLLTAVSMFVMYRPMLLTTATPPAAMYGAAKTVVDRLPVSLDAPPKTEMTVQTLLHVQPWSQRRFFKVTVDDCLRKITVNDHELPDDIRYCGTSSGRVFDFGPYMHTGNNLLTIVVRNKGGPMGADVVPVMTASLFLALVGLAVVCLWYAVSMTRMAMTLSQTSPAAHVLEMLYTLVARWKTSPFVPTASSSYLPSSQSKLSM